MTPTVVEAVGPRNRDGVLRYYGLTCDFAGGVAGPGVTGYKFTRPVSRIRGGRDFRRYRSDEWVFHLWFTP